MADFFGDIGRFGRGIFDQVNPFDNGRDFMSNYVQEVKPTATYTPPVSTYTPPKVDTSQDDRIKLLQEQNRLLQQQYEQRARLPAFDIMANYNRARSQAEQAVNPLYEKKLNDFLANVATRKTQKTKEADYAREGIETERTQGIQDIGTERTRTTEDVSAAIDRILQMEGEFQQDEGTQNEVERRALEEGLATAGLTTSGLGRQQVGQQQTQRNTQSERATQEFQAQRDAKTLFKDRTFADLATKEARTGEAAEYKKKGVQLDLDAFMENIGYEEQSFRFDNEAKRLGDIVTQTDAYRKSGIQQFLASLINSGKRAQDIALAQQVYGAQL